jgi:hypothetical protein
MSGQALGVNLPAADFAAGKSRVKLACRKIFASLRA